MPPFYSSLGIAFLVGVNYLTSHITFLYLIRIVESTTGVSRKDGKIFMNEKQNI
jgi:hypothetical protein